MNNNWPRVLMIGSGHLANLSISSAKELGIELITCDQNKNINEVLELAKTCDVVTFETNEISETLINEIEKHGITVRPSLRSFKQIKEFESGLNENHHYGVLVARSPHGQISTWAPAEFKLTPDQYLEVFTPALSEALSQAAQNLAIEIAGEINLIGTMCLIISEQSGSLSIARVSLGLSDYFNWTIEGATTSQFEQNLRAILDLPLGDTSLTDSIVVSRNIVCGDKLDMYRPYLHLMARSPKMKFHRYKSTPQPGANVGHLTLLGKNLAQLRGEALHAAEYFSGVIDE